MRIFTRPFEVGLIHSVCKRCRPKSECGLQNPARQIFPIHVQRLRFWITLRGKYKKQFYIVILASWIEKMMLKLWDFLISF